MTEELHHRNDEENLKAENEYLKMKLMLEEGAEFYISEPGIQLPADVENVFLNNIVQFEKQLRQGKRIKIADKLGNPQHFRPVAELSEQEIEKAWRELEEYMFLHGVGLDVCSPNISSRELYRFVVEELFQFETDDVNLPGWMTTFMYDEFYPDADWEATRAATDDCIHFLLDDKPIEWMHHFADDCIRLNNHYPLTREELKTIVNRFKQAYDSLEVSEIVSRECIILDVVATVTGSYRLSASDGKNRYSLKGKWKVVLDRGTDAAYWFVREVEIEGISF